MAGPITVSWALSQTSSDVLAVSKGVLIAATSDNVQALALLACESFGTTLAMAPESSAKVHQLCSQSHQSAVVKFLKAQIGYQKGDSGWQLSQSDAGLRFLGLTACLVTVDHWTAAEALNGLIRDTAVDRQLVPTSQQLKQLIYALDYRLTKSGFTDSVLGWGTWLDNATQQVYVTVNPPSRKVIEELVKATSNLGRLGQTQKLHARIPRNQAAWVIAFLKWCLGIPPTVMTSGRRTLLAQPDAQVLLELIMEPKDDDIEFRMLDEIGNIIDLIKELPDGLRELKGMVSVRTYAQKLLQHLGPPNSSPYRACVEALPYGCLLALSMLQIAPDDIWGTQEGTDVLKTSNIKSELPELEVTTGSIFPVQEEVFGALQRFLDLDYIPRLDTLPDDFQITELPLLQIARQDICSACPCKGCTGTSKNAKKKCAFEILMRNFSDCVATVLLTSLTVPGDPQEIFLRYKSAAPNQYDDLTSAIYHCLDGSGKRRCSFNSVVKRVLLLLGHEEGPSGVGAWVMSSFHGQTIYPELLETLTVGKNGLLNLLCIPGRLLWKETAYTVVERFARLREDLLADDESSNDSDSEDETEFGLVPYDAYQSASIVWNVSTRDNRLLISISAPSLPGMPDTYPVKAAWTATQSIFVDCPHDRMASLSTTDIPFCSVSPGRLPRNLSPYVGVIQSNCNEKIRFLTLTNGKPCVIRCDACLECCSKVCKIVGVEFIVC